MSIATFDLAQSCLGPFLYLWPKIQIIVRLREAGMATALKTLPDAPHAQPAGAVLARLGVSASKGLADEEIRHRLKVFGSNTVVSTSKASGLIILLHQFQSPVVYLLSAAAALAFYFGELEEGAAIVAVLGAQWADRLSYRVEGCTLNRGVACAGVAFGTRAARRPYPHNTSRADCAGRYRRAGGRRCRLRRYAAGRSLQRRRRRSRC